MYIYMQVLVAFAGELVWWEFVNHRYSPSFDHCELLYSTAIVQRVRVRSVHAPYSSLQRTLLEYLVYLPIYPLYVSSTSIHLAII